MRGGAEAEERKEGVAGERGREPARLRCEVRESEDVRTARGRKGGDLRGWRGGGGFQRGIFPKGQILAGHMGDQAMGGNQQNGEEGVGCGAKKGADASPRGFHNGRESTFCGAAAAEPSGGPPVWVPHGGPALVTLTCMRNPMGLQSNMANTVLSSCHVWVAGMEGHIMPGKRVEGPRHAGRPG